MPIEIPQQHLVIPGELYSSKNSQQIYRTPSGKPFITKSKKAKEHEKTLGVLLKDNNRRRQWAAMTEDKEFPLKVHVLVYRRTHGIFDYGNIFQNFWDAMKRGGYLIDDSARFLEPVYEPYIKDKNNPRVVLWVE